ncbi:MAG TPA: peptidoglycan editing factor PgeF [bacterium]|nr:peptidoglycan editing factor PgeF [bacterium]
MFFERSGSLYIGRFRELFRNRRLIHGFSTRPGGVSGVPFDTLNLGQNTSDDPGCVKENRNRFFQAVEISETQAVIPGQVHGVRIVRVTDPGIFPDTDGVITDAPGLALTVQTADCVPVFLVDPSRPAIGLVHAGWKGSALGIAAEGVRAMQEAFGSRPETLDIFLGPSIGPCCYEVGPDVAGRFEPGYVSGNRLDLWRYNVDMMIQSGARPERISTARLCTKCQPQWFFSHRARGGDAGRMLAVLAIQNKNGNE